MILTPIPASEVGPISRRSVALFGDAVGDHNPVHFDPEFARRAGLPDTVVHGPLTVALVVDRLVEEFGAERLLNIDVRLRGPVFPGDRLTVEPRAFGEADRGVAVCRANGDEVATAIVILAGDPDQ
ncbi:MAG TPA: acyl dehydratase [Acidimicrobiales bacterium]|nr:acyl dehydratase [Acidimicrobiales bacterium]